MMVLKVIDDDKAAANTFFKETALPLARNLETWIPTEIDNAPAFDYEGRGRRLRSSFAGQGMSTAFAWSLTERKKRGATTGRN